MLIHACRKAYADDMPFTKLLQDAACLPLFDGGNVGVRRRQIERIFQIDDYEPWVATYPDSSSKTLQ